MISETLKFPNRFQIDYKRVLVEEPICNISVIIMALDKQYTTSTTCQRLCDVRGVRTGHGFVVSCRGWVCGTKAGPPWHSRVGGCGCKLLCLLGYASYG